MIKILIVDDSEIHLEGMKTILKRSESNHSIFRLDTHVP